MIIIRPAIQSDFDFIKLNPLEEQAKNYPAHPLSGEVSTGLYDNIPFVIGGLFPLWNGVCEAWTIFTKEVLGFKYRGFMTIKSELDRMIEQSEYKRIQATIRMDMPKAIEMIEFLGFNNETPNGLKYYFPDGGTALLYARYK